MKILYYLIIILTGILLTNYSYLLETNLSVIIGWIIITLGIINIFYEIINNKKNKK